MPGPAKLSFVETSIQIVVTSGFSNCCCWVRLYAFVALQAFFQKHRYPTVPEFSVYDDLRSQCTTVLHV